MKTTQPRRYLVRPNQGLIAPNGSEQISILLVEKDKQILLQSYERLGQSGLDHSKDKFLVQSCTVGPAFAAKANGESSELYDALTAMWNGVTSGGSSTPIFNKKLHVRHVVAEGGSGGGAAASPEKPNVLPRSTPAGSGVKLEGASNSNMESMTQEQLMNELSNLRRKYDELVSFSVNLTAERDILSNTLEQTKRDFNREMAARSALENKQGGKSSAGGIVGGGRSFLGMLLQLAVIGFACYVTGVRMGSTGSAVDIPVAKMFLSSPPPTGGVASAAASVDSPVGGETVQQQDPPPVTEEL